MLISDNSDYENNDVQKCVELFNDKRIRYVKPPNQLPLTKSFEFAYLSCRGKYILSIGSDDALMPCAMETLEKYIKMYPEINVFNYKYSKSSFK